MRQVGAASIGTHNALCLPWRRTGRKREAASHDCGEGHHNGKWHHGHLSGERGRGLVVCWFLHNLSVCRVMFESSFGLMAYHIQSESHVDLVVILRRRRRRCISNPDQMTCHSEMAQMPKWRREEEKFSYMRLLFQISDTSFITVTSISAA